jgi:hypothetical protein
MGGRVFYQGITAEAAATQQHPDEICADVFFDHCYFADTDEYVFSDGVPRYDFRLEKGVYAQPAF